VDNITGGSHPEVGINSKTQFKSLQQSVCVFDSLFNIFQTLINVSLLIVLKHNVIYSTKISHSAGFKPGLRFNFQTIWSHIEDKWRAKFFRVDLFEIYVIYYHRRPIQNRPLHVLHVHKIGNQGKELVLLLARSLVWMWVIGNSRVGPVFHISTRNQMCLFLIYCTSRLAHTLTIMLNSVLYIRTFSISSILHT
jgi:hypothetical protein